MAAPFAALHAGYDLFSNAASNALAMACLLLPARAASPMTVTICPGRASAVKLPAVPRRAR